MLIRLLDVLSELFMLAFIIWTLAEASKRIRLVFYCIRRHDVQNAIANAIVLLLVFAFCAYVIWAFFDFHRSWGILVQ